MNLKLIGIIFSIVVLLNIFTSMSQIISAPDPTSFEPGSLADSPWPMFHQNLNHTGLSPYDTSSNLGNERWNFTTEYWIGSSPSIGSDGTIYVGSYDYKLYAINPDGTEKWNFKTGNQIRSSPGIGSDGTIYIGSDDHKLYAINPDGSAKWNFATGGKIWSAPAIGSDGTIYVGSHDYKLYAIYPNGSEKWSFTAGSELWISSPAIGADGTIYVGSKDLDNKLYAINPDGSEKWSFKTGYGLCSSPAIGSDGTIFVGSQDDKFYAIHPNGTEKWSFMANADVASSPAIGPDGTVYVGSDDGNLYAIGKNETPSQNQSPIADAGSNQNVTINITVYFDGSGSYDPDEDSLMFKWNFGDGTSTSWQTDCNSTHIYFNPGLYFATLYVNDSELIDSDTCIISVNGTGGSSPSPPFDSDGDGVPDNLDPHPESNVDTDKDYLPDDYELVITGTDPNNSDTDSDGVNDKNDYYPLDPTRYLESGIEDTDMDGIGDNIDAFPGDPAASVDSDGDGYPDNWNLGKSQESSTTGLILDAFPLDSTEWLDSDGDTIGDNSDAYPFDPERYLLEKSDDEKDTEIFTIIFIILIIGVIIIILLSIFVFRNKKLESIEPEDIILELQNEALTNQKPDNADLSDNEILAQFEIKHREGEISDEIFNIIQDEVGKK
ncbi:MAG: PQQ-binding-like beta-propeller repeat protein [Thermoplasmata archaeon]|nr:PQQ-binding-like beta-propeller repeat protein [Thermoplasmata archaeon]